MLNDLYTIPYLGDIKYPTLEVNDQLCQLVHSLRQYLSEGLNY